QPSDHHRRGLNSRDTLEKPPNPPRPRPATDSGPSRGAYAFSTRPRMLRPTFVGRPFPGVARSMSAQIPWLRTTRIAASGMANRPDFPGRLMGQLYRPDGRPQSSILNEAGAVGRSHANRSKCGRGAPRLWRRPARGEIDLAPSLNS